MVGRFSANHQFPQITKASGDGRFKMVKKIRLLTMPLSLSLMGLALTGCGEGGNQVNSSTSEIESFINENPDQLASPEDSPSSDADEFAAGNG
tara:strand:+ start:1029 stop:1307 length:279 start_codon:yes stop_codon:yes gene_type:complete